MNNRINNRGARATGAAPSAAVRWCLATVLAVLVSVGLIASTAGAASAAVLTPRIDLKVLLLGTSATDPDFLSWEGELAREGVRYDTVVGTANSALTSASLVSTLSDGTLEARYDAVIESVGGLTDCSTTPCTPYLTTAEQTALESYEHEFNIRQITGDIYPSATYGLNVPTVSGTLDATAGTLTADGQKDFPYLKASAPITMDTGTYGYEATPISATNFDTLVSGPSGSALVGIYTHTDGVQELVETFDQNANQLQAELLRHGALAWATRGVFFGDQRNYLETDVDDNFLSDDSWSIAGNATTAAHSTDFNPADALREVPADVTAAAAWSKANNFRIDMLFNGGGSVAVADGDSLVGSGDGGSGGAGTTGTTGGSATGTDPLLAAFQATDPATGKPYTDDFGWISHTWDHPNIDEGCATQDYIEAELNQNTTWGTTAAESGDPINGGLGLTASTDPTDALGNENPNVVITGEHSGLANLLPGNPGQVDPPGLDSAVASTTGGALAAGEYVYAISDQFNTAAPTATPVAGTGESAASVSDPVTVTGATSSVTLTWGAVCHAADYKIYRAPFTPSSAGATTGTIGTWSLITPTPVVADPATDFTNPTGSSTTDTTGGGAIEKTFTDTGTETTAAGSPQTAGTADESAYEQNPVLDAAFAGTLDGGIKYFGADASKPYPSPADGSFATGAFGGAATEYASGQSFQDAGATAIPRYPTNIYYNAATNAQEVDEYETLYDEPSCTPISGVTTCNPAGTTVTIAQIVASIDQGMFQHMMGNDPRPDYFHQTNLMDQTTGSVNGEGSGLFYETVNPLLAEYDSYFASSAPIEQPTMAQIGTLLSEQAAWTANTTVSGYIQGNQVTITNSGTAAVEAPLSGTTSVGSLYGGTQSGWTSLPVGTSTFTASTTWPADAITVALAPGSVVANGTTTSVATATVTADGAPVAGDPITFTSTDPAEKIGAVTDNANGTYTATITSSTTIAPATITATDAVVAPTASGLATLNQTAGVPTTLTVALAPASIAANGADSTTATASITDAQNHPVAGEHVVFTSTDPGETIGAVTDNHNGTYTATITSSTTTGTRTITATDTAVSPTISGTAQLTQTVGPAAALTVALAPASIAANGADSTTATASITDAQNHPVAGEHVVFTSTDPGETIGAVTDNHNGTYTATITSSTTTGTPTITATDTAVSPTISGTAQLTQTVGPAAALTVALAPASIAANGADSTTATASITDAQNHPVAGEHVVFTSTDPGETIGAVTDNHNGTYTATITSSTTTGTPTITATDTAVSPNLTASAQLTQSTPQGGPAGDQTPSISGTVVVGRTLAASPGSWSGVAPIAYRYQWQRCLATCEPIAGATASSYTLTSADRGAHVEVAVTASNSLGSATAVSAPVGPVTAVTAAQMRALLMAALAPTGPAARVAALLKHHGFTHPLIAPLGGQISIAWYRALGATHAGGPVLARVTATLTGGSVTAIRVTLTHHGLALIRASHTLRLRATGRLSLTGFAAVTAGRTFVVKR